MSSDLIRLRDIEARVREIAHEEGLEIAETEFEVVSSRRMMEAMAYQFPTNFSHWTFGRDFEKTRTTYEHTGHGIPYEIVWNLKNPVALLVETNPLALNALIVCHVYGHVDFFLRNRYLRRVGAITDMESELRSAAARFQRYEDNYGRENVERTIDAGMSLQWHLHPDIMVEQAGDEEIRRRMIWGKRKELENLERDEFYRGSDRKVIEEEIKALERRTPPVPVFDLLSYIGANSPNLAPWQRDILRVLRMQARALAPQARTKILNEGWATYWHLRIMRRLFREELLTPEEHGVFLRMHSGVIAASGLQINPYRVGLALYKHIESRYNEGRFGKDWDSCEDPIQRKLWNRDNVGAGREKIFEVASAYTDRRAIQEFFDNEFIRSMQLYLFQEKVDGDRYYVIVEDDPEKLRAILLRLFGSSTAPPIVITNANYHNRQELYLRHEMRDVSFDLQHLEGTLQNVFSLWGRKVYLEVIEEGKQVVYSCNGEKLKKES